MFGHNISDSGQITLRYLGGSSNLRIDSCEKLQIIIFVMIIYAQIIHSVRWSGQPKRSTWNGHTPLRAPDAPQSTLSTQQVAIKFICI